MKNLIDTLYWEANRSLESMHKSDMTLTERIKYEKALVQLDIMKRILDKHTLSL